MTQFFFRDEDEKRAAQSSSHMDDIDMIQSPIDGKLVVVAQSQGRHVCQMCGELFDPTDSQLRGVEVHIGYSRVLLHAKCSGQPKRSLYYRFHDNVRGVQVRRKLAEAARSSQTVAEAAEKNSKKVVA